MSRTTIGRNIYKFTSKPKSPADRVIERYTTRLPPKLPAHQSLDRKELDDIHKIFKYFDKNGDYQLDSTEHQNFVQWSSGNTVDSPVSQIFRSIDLDENSRISLPEFVDYAARRKNPLPLKSDLMKLFYKYDRDDDNCLNIEEARLVMLELGDQPAAVGFARAFGRFDRDKDGLLDADEFVNFVQNESVRAKVK